MVDKQPITEQSRQNLIKLNLMNLGVTSEQLDLLRAEIRSLDDLSLEVVDTKSITATHMRQMRRIYEYMMLIGLIANDLSVIYRVYLRAEDPYEVQYASKQIVVILTEGFKQVYNFISVNEEGHLVTRNRNKSIWKKDIGKIIKSQLPTLIEEYNEITKDLEDYDDADLKAMHAPRNIFVHYDPKPCLVYDELIAVHIERVTQKAIPFLAILQRMMSFNFKMTKAYVKVTIQATKDAFVEHKGVLEKMMEDNLYCPESVKIIEEGIDNLARLKADYDKKQGV